MSINFELLDAAINDAATGAGGYVHSQLNWVQPVTRDAETIEQCGTALCLAGFAAVRAGAEVPPLTRGVAYWYMPDWVVDSATGAYRAEGSAYPAEGSPRAIHISEFARREMGLTDAQADLLFHEHNTLDDIRTFRQWLYANPDASDEAVDDFAEAVDRE